VPTILRSLLPEDVVAKLRAALKPELFQPGAGTASGLSKAAKDNLQLTCADPVGRECANVVVRALQSNDLFNSVALPVKITPPMFSLYRESMAYGLHVDSALMYNDGKAIRTDLSMTLFLTPPEEYDGGELVFNPPGSATHMAKLPAGSAIIYPSTTLHEVASLTRGSRLACVLWIQSAVREQSQRDLLAEIDKVRAAIDGNDMAQSKKGLVLIKQNLLRRWSST